MLVLSVIFGLVSSTVIEVCQTEFIFTPHGLHLAAPNAVCKFGLLMFFKYSQAGFIIGYFRRYWPRLLQLIAFLFAEGGFRCVYSLLELSCGGLVQDLPRISHG